MIRIASFAGEIPRILPRLLPENYAQIAENVKLDQGGITPIRRARHDHRLTEVAGSIYKWRGEWLSWSSNVSVARAPVAEDRLYFTGDGAPKMRVGDVVVPLAVPSPTQAVTASIADESEIDHDLSSTILYTYTWVSPYGEESEPAPLGTGILWSPGLDVTVSGFEAPPVSGRVTRMRIYRSQTSSLGETQLYFIRERDISNLDFVDVVADNPANELLPSTSYHAPPDNLQGIVSLPNGMMAAFAGKKLYFCEPYIPHAWPESYILTTDYEIVGLGVFGASMAVLTTGNPYVVNGSAPDNMMMERLPLNLPCIAPKAIVDLGYSIAYPSHDGLVIVSGSSADVATRQLMTRDQWLQMSPHTFVAGQYGGRYMASYRYNDAGGDERRGIIIFDLRGEQPFIVRNGDDADDLFYEIETGSLYLLRNFQDIYEWDAAGEPYGDAYWLSKRFVLTSETNFGAILVEGEGIVTAQQRAAAVARNKQIIEQNKERILTGQSGGAIADTAVGLVPFAGSLLQEVEDLDSAIAITIYADGRYVATIYDINKPVRLPSGFLAKTWEIEVRGAVQVHTISLGMSPAQLGGQ